MPLMSQTIRPGTVTNISAHWTSPLVVRDRFFDVLTHAHFQTPSTPRPSSSPAFRRFRPRRALTRRLRVARFLSTKMARSALVARHPSRVNVFTPHFVRVLVAIPRARSAA